MLLWLSWVRVLKKLANSACRTLVTVKIKPVAVNAYFSDEYVQGCDHCATSGRMLSNVPYWKTSVTRTKQSTNACVRLNGEKHKFLEFHWSQLYLVHCGKQKFEILSWFAFHFYFMIRWLLFWFLLEGVFKSLCKTDQTNFCSADKNQNARTW